MTFSHLFKITPFFLAAVLWAQCQPAGADKLFTCVPPAESGVAFANNLHEDEHFNIIKYLYFYNGGGVATGDVNNDGLPDIFFTANQLSNKLYINKGNFVFEDVTKEAGLEDVTEPGKRWKTGVTMADVNADGWLDIYVCEVGFYKSVNGRNRLYINNHDGTFSEQAVEYGLAFKGFSQQASFFDYDLDGDLDMFLATHSVHSAESYVKAENRVARDSMAKDVLFRNDGNHFTDVSEAAGIYGGTMGYGLGLVTADLNNDGLPDVYVTNDFHENDYLYLNGKGAFRESIALCAGHTSTFSMGVDAADLNNDGLADLMTLDMQPADEPVLKASAGADHYNLYQMKLGYGYYYQYPKNCLQLGQPGSAQFDSLQVSSRQAGNGMPGVGYQEIGEIAGVAATDWSWSTLLADFDNDGWKDIYVTNGIWRRPNDLDYLMFASNQEVQRQATDLELAAKMPQGLVPNRAFQNQLQPGSGPSPIPIFKDVSKDWGLDLPGSSNGAAYADFDNDGDLDLVVNNLNAPATIYRNNGEKLYHHNFLKIKLAGEGGNPFGIGARVEVASGGTVQVQQLFPTRGWESSSDLVLNVGLGKNEKADKITVTWPGGRQQVLTQIPANQTITVKQADAITPVPTGYTNSNEAKQKPLFRPIPNLPIFHKENRFVDFNIEPLMPHMLSTQGPKMAVADVNGDGLDDFYLCGAKAQAGQLVLGSRDSLFSGKVISAPFQADFLNEDVDAVFFDADGDGDPDLFVVSGGGEYREGAAQLLDRLYFNDGQGNFSNLNNTGKSTAWPSANGACAVPADFNGDGATDLFIGSRSVPGSYGRSPKSFIYLNDGKGNFRDATAEICPALSDAGMVTSAVWLPGEQLLAVVGEWMPIQFFRKGKAGQTLNTLSSLPRSSGFWNTIAAADMDGDGDLDLLAGNLGLNTSLTASPDAPVGLYVKDFDRNGATDPILTYYNQGKQYTLASKDDLVGQINELKKRYVKYAAFANSTFKDIFDEEMLEGAVLKQADNFQSVFLENKGDGVFEMRPLPMEAQVSPIYAFLPGDFDGDGSMDALAVGNFYANQPYLGRYDALNGLLLRGDGNGKFSPLAPAQSGFYVPGEGRDIKLLIATSGRKRVLVARNNDTVVGFELRGD
ncbi:MAG: VCBS repeat-containing protein [Saprospiraceae bacterium]|nr:VCBS repeat-containing protein [Saprospiraceae bacterium]